MPWWNPFSTEKHPAEAELDRLVDEGAEAAKKELADEISKLSANQEQNPPEPELTPEQKQEKYIKLLVGRDKIEMVTGGITTTMNFNAAVLLVTRLDRALLACEVMNGDRDYLLDDDHQPEPGELSTEEAAAIAKKFREDLAGRVHSDSAAILREERDRSEGP